MKKYNGFSLSEVIIAMGIMMILVATALPIYHLVAAEEHRIKQHQLIKHAMHDELQQVIWGNMELISYRLKIASRNVDVSFTMEGDYVKGCAEWQNVRNKEETICLYGVQEQ